MPAHRPAGILLVLAGIFIVLIGVLVWSGALRWFGHLPGDMQIARPNLRVYIPITSMLLLSLALTLVLHFGRRLF